MDFRSQYRGRRTPNKRLPNRREERNVVYFGLPRFYRNGQKVKVDGDRSARYRGADARRRRRWRRRNVSEDARRQTEKKRTDGGDGEENAFHRQQKTLRANDYFWGVVHSNDAVSLRRRTSGRRVQTIGRVIPKMKAFLVHRLFAVLFCYY